MARSNKKKPACIDDIRKRMDQLNIKVANNIISGTIEISGLPPKYSHENALNILPCYLYDEIKSHGSINASRLDINDALMSIADENRFNPVKDMLERAPHDGFERILILKKILGIEADPHSCRILEKWLHQTIAMALNNEDEPYGADGVLVLQGEQGAGKTFFCSKLAMYPDLFAEGVSIDLNNKDTVIQSTGVWISELGELDSTLRREQAQLKAFITSKKDIYRLPYGKAAISRTRRTSFCATVNPDVFLNDETGSRRFWVIHVGHIDIEHLKTLDETWFQQLWRQVYEQMFVPNPQGFRLTAEERRKLQEKNRIYEKPLPGEIEITDNLDFESNVWGWYRVSTVIELLGLRGISAAQVGKVLSKLTKSHPEITMKNTHNVKQYYLPKVPKLV